MDITNIQFFKAKDLVKNLRATIHKSGKLGFTSDAATHLKLPNYKSANIGTNKSDGSDKNLYLLLCTESEGEFKVVKAGEYYYISTRILFDNLKLNYANETISYDITPIKQGDVVFYSMKKREKVTQRIDNDDLI
jgi:hypothetical protein